MTNLDNILKTRAITLSTKAHLVKVMVFPVFMHECESWTIKKAEHRRIDAFELWCWRRLESPLDCKEIKPVSPKGNQSWKVIERTDAEAEAPILWPPDAKRWLIRKDLDAGKDWRQRRRKQKRMRWLNGIPDSPRRWWRAGKPGVLQSMGSQRVRHDWATEQEVTSKNETPVFASVFASMQIFMSCCLLQMGGLFEYIFF